MAAPPREEDRDLPPHAKGDNAAYVLDRARAGGREDDVAIIRLDGDCVWNTPTAIANKLVTGLQLMTDQESNTYYFKMQREFAENTLQTLADVLGAGRVSMMDLFEFICDPKVQEKYLDAAAPMNAIAFDWFVNQRLTETPAEQKMLTKGLRADLSSFVRADMAPTFATADANFPGRKTIVDGGKIVIFSMSLDEYGLFPGAVGIFTLMDWQNVMLARTTTKSREAGHDVERLFLYIIDGIWAYVNENLGEVAAVPLQAKCCTLALHLSCQVDDYYRPALFGNEGRMARLLSYWPGQEHRIGARAGLERACAKVLSAALSGRPAAGRRAGERARSQS